MQIRDERAIIKDEFDITIHRELTIDANNASSQLFTEGQLAYVIIANMGQDLRQTESKVHFDNCCFIDGSNYIEKNWKDLEAYDPLSEQAFNTFGCLLHTVQDFYAHSNWVELHQDERPIPIWNLDIATLPSGIVSGTWSIGSPKRCPHDAPSHKQLNKDDPYSHEGKIVVSSGPNTGKSLYDLAYEVALSASNNQFKRYRELLKRACLH